MECACKRGDKDRCERRVCMYEGRWGGRERGRRVRVRVTTRRGVCVCVCVRGEGEREGEECV